MSTLTTSQETVTATAALLIDDQSKPNVINDGIVSFTVYNTSETAVYLGGSDEVTTASGFPIPPGAALSFDMGIGAKVWAIAESSAQVRVAKVS
jgi:hypothetical protein